MDTRRPRSLRDFIELARRKTAESRSELFGNIADLFLSDRVRLSDRERSLMTGILRSLIATVEAGLMREISAMLGERGDLPDALHTFLTGRPADIARPILMRSHALREPELIELIKYRGREHQLAVAMRPALASETVDHAPAPDLDDPIEAALHGAPDSLSGSASDYLVAESERIDRLKMPVLTLADLPADMVRRLHWLVAAALRTHMVDALPVSPNDLDGLIETATRALAERYASEGTGMVSRAQNLIGQLAEAETLTVEPLIRLLRAGRIPAFIAGLAHIASIPWAVARRIALQPDGYGLAVLCRASAIDGDSFLTLYELISSGPAGSTLLPADERNSILTFYDKVTKGNARAALEFWRRDPEFVSALDQVSPVTEDPLANQ